jgi:hypothetical protein
LNESFTTAWPYLIYMFFTFIIIAASMKG